MGDPKSTKDNIQRPDSIMKGETCSNQTPPPDPSPNSTIHTEPNDATRSTSPPRHMDDDPNPNPLPSGWAIPTSKEGKKYYIDHPTRTTHWHPPSNHPTPPRPSSDARESDLPAGWEQRQTTNGETYFVDHNTRTTSWLGPHGDVHDTTQLLPKGWERRETREGRAYFLDHDARTTSWYPPWLTEADQSQYPGSGGDTEDKLAMNTEGIDSKTAATVEGCRVVSKL